MIIKLYLLGKIKQLFLIFLLYIAALNVKAQQHVSIDTCQNLAQYEGEWKYANGQDTLKIFLRSHRFYSVYDNGDGWIHDNLIGWIDYRTSAGIIESTYQNRYTTFPLRYDSDSMDISKMNMFLFMPECNDALLKLQGQVWDELTQKREFSAFISIDPSKTVMTWKVFYPENYIKIDGIGYTRFLPEEFVLVKQ